MNEARATLQLDLDAGRNANAVMAGRALSAWAETLEDASRLIDPLGIVSIELVGTEVGCLRLHALLRYLEHDLLDPVADALRPYPQLKAALALNVFNLPGAITAGVVGGIIAAHYSTASPAAQQAATTATARLESAPALLTKTQSFYSFVNRDPGISGVKIFEDSDPNPIVSVPRQEIQALGGLWTPPPVEQGGRPRHDVWDVVVTHPVAVSKPLKWGFKVNGLPFRAKIKDSNFLLAIREGTLPLQVHEGLAMRVAVSWADLPVGDHWEADVKSYEITEVLWPTPLRRANLSAGPLFGKHDDSGDDER